MAGSEKAGIRNSQVDLFKDSLCVVTPGPGSNPLAVSRVRRMWEKAGCRTLIMPAADHDRRIALTSHLPHLAASILAEILRRKKAGDGQILKLVSTGFRDTTRVAASDPAMWRDILLTNREALLSALGIFEADLKKWKALLKSGNGPAIVREFKKTSQFRRSL